MEIFEMIIGLLELLSLPSLFEKQKKTSKKSLFLQNTGMSIRYLVHKIGQIFNPKEKNMEKMIAKIGKKN